MVLYCARSALGSTESSITNSGGQLARMCCSSGGNWSVPKRSQVHTDVDDNLAQQGRSTNHGTVRYRGHVAKCAYSHGSLLRYVGSGFC
jgi:hypothetical protein